jgi:Icc-related predicted phosphoesterase
MSAQTKIYFVTDIHGSERCFRKFLNAGPLYNADVMIMGGDLAGKELLIISEKIGGSGYTFIVNGKSFEIETDEELKEAKQFIADLGFYSYVGQSEDIQAMQIEDHWLKLMGETIAKYTDRIEIKNGTLFIYTEVAPLKNELVFQKELIVKRINESLGDDVVKDVVTPLYSTWLLFPY